MLGIIDVRPSRGVTLRGSLDTEKFGENFFRGKPGIYFTLRCNAPLSGLVDAAKGEIKISRFELQEG